MRRSLHAAALGAVLLPVAVAAQEPCKPPKNSNVAKMLAWFAGPIAFAPQGPARPLPRGAVIVAGDLTWVPRPSRAITQTDFCYASKSENTGLAPVFPRPRVIVGLGAGLSLEASWLPPVTVADATPNLASVAVGWVRPLGTGRALDLTVRAHATFGSVKGPITCPTSALQQTGPPGCWGDTPSKDTYEPNVSGVEIGVASSGERWSWYGGAGVASLMPRFQVGFTYLNGTADNTRVQVDLTRVTAFGGVAWAWTKRVELSAQLYAVPGDAITGRAGLSWRLR